MSRFTAPTLRLIIPFLGKSKDNIRVLEGMLVLYLFDTFNFKNKLFFCKVLVLSIVWNSFRWCFAPFFWQCPSPGNICWNFFCMQCFHNWGWETFDKCTLCWTCYTGNPLNSPTDMVVLFLWKRQNELKEMPERAKSIYTCSVPESPRKNGREKKKIRTGANTEIMLVLLWNQERRIHYPH